MGEMIESPSPPGISIFNGPIEIGLRALAVLSEAFPAQHSLQRLVIFDYLVVHSDDIAGGPPGLHPKTPYRSGELLVRRKVLQQGLRLFESRDLIERCFNIDGISYRANDYSAGFLDAFDARYVSDMRSRANWLVATFGAVPEEVLQRLVHDHIGEWGAEFESESVLWSEELL